MIWQFKLRRALRCKSFIPVFPTNCCCISLLWLNINFITFPIFFIVLLPNFGTQKIMKTCLPGPARRRRFAPGRRRGLCNGSFRQRHDSAEKGHCCCCCLLLLFKVVSGVIWHALGQGPTIFLLIYLSVAGNDRILLIFCWGGVPFLLRLI